MGSCVSPRVQSTKAKVSGAQRLVPDARRVRSAHYCDVLGPQLTKRAALSETLRDVANRPHTGTLGARLLPEGTKRATTTPTTPSLIRTVSPISSFGSSERRLRIWRVDSFTSPLWRTEPLKTAVRPAVNQTRCPFGDSERRERNGPPQGPGANRQTLWATAERAHIRTVLAISGNFQDGWELTGRNGSSRRRGLAVAVGTIIADRPPHRSVRALLRIRLPPRMTGVKALHRIRMENASDWNPSVYDPAKPVHGDPAALAAPR